LTYQHAKFDFVGWMKNQMHMFRHHHVAKKGDFIMITPFIELPDECLDNRWIGQQSISMKTGERYDTRCIQTVEVPQIGHLIYPLCSLDEI